MLNKKLKLKLSTLKTTTIHSEKGKCKKPIVGERMSQKLMKDFDEHLQHILGWEKPEKNELALRPDKVDLVAGICVMKQTQGQSLCA